MTNWLFFSLHFFFKVSVLSIACCALTTCHVYWFSWLTAALGAAVQTVNHTSFLWNLSCFSSAIKNECLYFFLHLSPTIGDVEKYINGHWQKIPVEDHLKMTKLDGQVWISLYNVLLKEDCQRKYDFNSFNKNQLLKVTYVLNTMTSSPLGYCTVLLKGILASLAQWTN